MADRDAGKDDELIKEIIRDTKFSTRPPIFAGPKPKDSKGASDTTDSGEQAGQESGRQRSAEDTDADKT